MPANGSDPVQIMKLIQPGLEEMQYRKTHTNGASVDSLSLLFRLGMPIYKRLSPGYHFEEGYLCLFSVNDKRFPGSITMVQRSSR